MNKITPAAADRCAKKSFQEQLEDARRQMQRESGASDMRTIDAHLEADNWQTRIRKVSDIGIPTSGFAMRIEGCD